MESSLEQIKSRMKQSALKAARKPNDIRLLAVTKNQTRSAIENLIDGGQFLFGENRVQEAHLKWPFLKKKYPQCRLHLIGHLQSNKIKQAISLFDVIETLDSIPLAEKLAREEKNQQKHLIYYIQINIGHESQKNGIPPNDVEDFFTALKAYPLDVQGIMCIPPLDKDPTHYFSEMAAIAKKHCLSVISMGMSNDFETAIQCGATEVRIGTALFKT